DFHVTGVQTCALPICIEMRTLVERASRWLLGQYPSPLDSEQIVDSVSVPVQRLMADLPEMLPGAEHAAFVERRDELVEHGVEVEIGRAACRETGARLG